MELSSKEVEKDLRNLKGRLVEPDDYRLLKFGVKKYYGPDEKVLGGYYIRIEKGWLYIGDNVESAINTTERLK